MKKFSKLKRALLRELSLNSRISVSDLARKLKHSRNSIISNLESLEKELGIVYVVQFYRVPLGITQNQFWLIKFGIRPDSAELKQLFAKDPYVRMVARTEGDFDLLINVLLLSEEQYSRWAIMTIRSLLKYKPSIRAASVIANHLGYIPFTDQVIREADLGKYRLDELDKEILMLLNKNARMGYNEIAEKLGRNIDTVRYRFAKIMKAGLINRFSIIITKPPLDYTMAFCMNFNWSEGVLSRYEKARQYYLSVDGRLPVINRYQYLVLTSGNFSFFGMGCFENEELALKGTVEKHKELFEKDKPEISTARVVEVISGMLPIRDIDVKKAFDQLPKY